MSVSVDRVNDVVNDLAGQFLGAIAEQLRRSRIDQDATALAVEAEDGVGRVFENQRQVVGQGQRLARIGRSPCPTDQQLSFG